MQKKEKVANEKKKRENCKRTEKVKQTGKEFIRKCTRKKGSMRNGGIRNVRSFVSRSRYERKGTMCEEGRVE